MDKIELWFFERRHGISKKAAVVDITAMKPKEIYDLIALQESMGREYFEFKHPKEKGE